MNQVILSSICVKLIPQLDCICLQIWATSCIREKVITACDSLSVLALLNIGDDDADQISAVYTLLQNASNLREFSIKVSFYQTSFHFVKFSNHLYLILPLNCVKIIFFLLSPARIHSSL